MKIENFVEGILVIVFGAILFADAFQVTYNPASQLLSPNDVKGIAGFVFTVMAIFYFIEPERKNKSFLPFARAFSARLYPKPKKTRASFYESTLWL